MKTFAELPPELQAILEQEKLEALAEFAAGAGHEMNNPLAVISGRAQLLLGSEQDPERRRELAIIHAQAMRVHEMIADLMLFARPPQPQLAPLDLSGLCRQLLAEISPVAKQRQIELRADIAEGVSLSADAAQIAVALRVLLTNSLEALGNQGAISLSCHLSDDGRSARITVSDNGPGIPPEIRRHLFDPYFSGRPAGRGLGLGLSKCWRIVTNHGGRVEVRPMPAGTAVEIQLRTVGTE